MSLSMPSDKALAWLLAPAFLLGMQVFEFHVGAQPRAVVDLRPGEVLHGPSFKPEPCAGEATAVGRLIAPRCVAANRISASDAGVYDHMSVRRSRGRERWARVRNDAVLAYCGLEWCRVVAVAPDRFAPDRAAQ